MGSGQAASFLSDCGFATVQIHEADLLTTANIFLQSASPCKTRKEGRTSECLFYAAPPPHNATTYKDGLSSLLRSMS